jgi:hypothetical protein
MNLSRKQIRDLIIEEMTALNKVKPLNEALGVASFVALAALALSGAAGISYIGVNYIIDRAISNDPRVKKKLEGLGKLVSENPEMNPADIARLAAKNDPELAAILQEIDDDLFDEFLEANPGFYF